MSDIGEIVKVQRSIVTTCEDQQVLIYSEDRSITDQGDLSLDGQAPWQEW